jgi:hypothetical protein
MRQKEARLAARAGRPMPDVDRPYISMSDERVASIVLSICFATEELARGGQAASTTMRPLCARLARRIMEVLEDEGVTNGERTR